VVESPNQYAIKDEGVWWEDITSMQLRTNGGVEEEVRLRIRDFHAQIGECFLYNDIQLVINPRLLHVCVEVYLGDERSSEVVISFIEYGNVYAKHCV